MIKKPVELYIFQDRDKDFETVLNWLFSWAVNVVTDGYLDFFYPEAGFSGII